MAPEWEIAMTENIGTIDRTLRVIVGLFLVGLAVGIMPEYQTAWGWLGVIPLFTGLAGSCPVYSMLGIKTCRT
jgi:hypothetical protein